MMDARPPILDRIFRKLRTMSLHPRLCEHLAGIAPTGDYRVVYLRHAAR